MKKVVSRRFYLLTFSLFAVVVLLTLAPIVIPGARFIYDPAPLTVLFAILSLAISMVLFGLIGDSSALVSTQTPNGFKVQIAGSAAGFCIFFYLLSVGLAPYSALVVYLYKGEGVLAQRGDGPIDVTIAGKVRRTNATSDGEVTFSFLPKSEDRRLLVSPPWKIASIEPKSCVSGDNIILSGCDKVDVRIGVEPPCARSAEWSTTDITPLKGTTLPRVMEEIQNQTRVQMRGKSVALVFSDLVYKEQLNQTKFDLQRTSGAQMSACGHLDYVVQVFNQSQNGNVLKVAASCEGFLVMKTAEPIPEGYSLCTK